MDDYDFSETRDDFSLLTLEEMRTIGTNHSELKSIRHSKMPRWRAIDGYPLEDCFFIVIGYSSKSRFLQVALNYDSEGDRFVYHQVKLADEEEIKRLWCG